MMSHHAHVSVADLVTQQIDRARVFERLGIDYCCHGSTSLEDACREKGLDVGSVLRELEAVEPTSTIEDWSRASLTELVDHIETTHHQYLSAELPRISVLLEKVVQAHLPRHRELATVRAVFTDLRAELELHMMKEENVLFPMIRQLETSPRQPFFHCGTIANPIHVMVMEHDDAGEALARIRQLTGGFAPPADACPTYMVLLSALEQLETDMHLHIHKENNILFPKAQALEARLTSQHAIQAW